MEEKSSDHSLSPFCPRIHGISGDPQVLPRVGHEYQAEIPPLTTELIQVQQSANTKQMADMENQMDCRSNLVNQNAVRVDGMDVNLHSLPQMKSSMELNSEIKDYIPVTTSQGSTWSELEQESFLLGLYIFGKDLSQVKRFVDSKEMGHVLCFYYGKFYRSDGYLRWSKCRNIRSRKCIHGQRIFRGWRQQELLSRLLPCTPEDCRNTLLEASKTFNEGKFSLEKYVSTLKAAVGLKVLVEAVGIGKGKYDLTNNMEHVKMNQVTAATSKACSSLTSDQIINFLTGGFRLSKTRSNDLFWEAVWPRLLAKGWHCEQTENYTCVTSRHSLVFLIPGIDNLSRGELVKGNHYFDSISDVLNKVASDPRLLEPELKAINSGICEEENGCGPTAILKNLSDRRRAPNHDLELMKLTVVDTSSIHEKKPSKVREFRTVVLNDNHDSSYAIFARGANEHSFQVQVEKPGSADTGVPDESIKGNDISFEASPPNCVLSLSKQGFPIDATLTDIQYSEMLKKKNCAKSLKCESNGKEQSTKPKLLAPIIKRRRLSACISSDHCTNESCAGPKLKEEDPQLFSSSIAAQDIISTKLVPLESKISMSTSSKESMEGSSKHVLGEGCFGTSTTKDMPSHENLQVQNAIDRSTTQIPSDYVMSKTFTIEVTGSQSSYSNTEGSSFISDSNERPEGSHSAGTYDSVGAERQPTVNSRRHSTRNRPLTRRVLEAYETGLFGTRRRRSAEVMQ